MGKRSLVGQGRVSVFSWRLWGSGIRSVTSTHTHLVHVRTGNPLNVRLLFPWSRAPVIPVCVSIYRCSKLECKRVRVRDWESRPLLVQQTGVGWGCRLGYTLGCRSPKDSRPGTLDSTGHSKGKTRLRSTNRHRRHWWHNFPKARLGWPDLPFHLLLSIWCGRHV